VLLCTPLHAYSNFKLSVQLANKRGFKQNKKKKIYIYKTTDKVEKLLNSKQGEKIMNGMLASIPRMYSAPISS
jgi:hypothetical protein